MLLARRGDGHVLLERRPERGVWGGLWCPPQFPSLDAARLYAETHLEAATLETEARPVLRHAFTHFELEITPVLVQCRGQIGVMEQTPTVWYNPAEPERLGMPAPVTVLIQGLA